MDTYTKRPLYIYVLAITIVWTVILVGLWLLSTKANFHTYSLVFLGFALGMLAMYIAVHIYEWR